MRIFVEQLEFVGRHGWYDHERREGRRFRVDVAVELDRPGGASSDQLDHTVDYRDVAEVVLAVSQQQSYRLIERLADEIIERLFERFPAVDAAELTVRKMAPGVPGAPRWVGVDLRRQRQ